MERDDTSGFSFFALPDTRMLQVSLDARGRPRFGRRNALSLPEELSDFLSTEAPEYWYPQPDDRFPQNPDWIINKCTDPDTYGEALDWLKDRYGQTSAIFNHPDAVRMTTRDAVSKRLNGIDGLIVPRCERFRFQTEADLMRVFRKNGFEFPVLVRPSEFQTGQGMVRVDSDADWSKLLYSPWHLKDHFMTQYVDCQNDENAYFKARVLFIGGKPFVRHVKASAEWLVHNNRRVDVAGFPERELRFVDELEADHEFMAVCHSVAERLPLDSFGMDIGVDLPRKRFVLFEANPSMNVFFPERTGRPEGAKARRDRLQHPAMRHMSQVIRAPESWHYAPKG